MKKRRGEGGYRQGERKRGRETEVGRGERKSEENEKEELDKSKNEQLRQDMNPNI